MGEKFNDDVCDDIGGGEGADVHIIYKLSNKRIVYIIRVYGLCTSQKPFSDYYYYCYPMSETAFAKRVKHDVKHSTLHAAHSTAADKRPGDGLNENSILLLSVRYLYNNMYKVVLRAAGARSNECNDV